MVKKLREWPEKNEYVVITITALNPNSAFANLDEYSGRRGMVHVSEVAATWIRDIRRFLRVGQRVVAVVRNVDKERDTINLSIKRVSAGVRKEKLTEFGNEKKAEKLLEMAAKTLGKDLPQAYDEVGKKLQERFGLLYPAFEKAAFEGAKVLAELGIDEKWAAAIEEIAKKTIKAKEVFIKAMLELKSYSPNGIEIIKIALAEGVKKTAGAVVEIKYISAPRYLIGVKGADYASCEKTLQAVSESIISAVEKSGGEAQMIREK